MYRPILHLPRVELHCKLQEKLHRVTGLQTFPCMVENSLLTGLRIAALKSGGQGKSTEW